MGEIEEIVNLVAANTIPHGDVEYDADAVAKHAVLLCEPGQAVTARGRVDMSRNPDENESRPVTASNGHSSL